MNAIIYLCSSERLSRRGRCGNTKRHFTHHGCSHRFWARTRGGQKKQRAQTIRCSIHVYLHKLPASPLNYGVNSLAVAVEPRRSTQDVVKCIYSHGAAAFHQLVKYQRVQRCTYSLQPATATCNIATKLGATKPSGRADPSDRHHICASKMAVLRAMIAFNTNQLQRWIIFRQERGRVDNQYSIECAPFSSSRHASATSAAVQENPSRLCKRRGSDVTPQVCRKIE